MTQRPDSDLLLRQMASLLEDCDRPIASLANASALLWHALPDLNWCGFYLLSGQELVLGPFQGKIACMRIALGRGVCGNAAFLRKTLRIPDVHAFPGHIACDSASNSEIVVPLCGNEDRIMGVLDLDSPLLDRFSETDEAFLNQFATLLCEQIDWNHGWI